MSASDQYKELVSRMVYKSLKMFSLLIIFDLDFSTITGYSFPNTEDKPAFLLPAPTSLRTGSGIVVRCYVTVYQLI